MSLLLATAVASALWAGTPSFAARPSHQAVHVNSDPDLTFDYTGHPEKVTVPDGITQAEVEVVGASGGWTKYYFCIPSGPYACWVKHTAAGGQGARIVGSLPVHAGDVLTIGVGGHGGDGVRGIGGEGGWGATGKGGRGGDAGGYGGGGGGGATAILDGDKQLVVAGGGGGGGGFGSGENDRGGTGGSAGSTPTWGRSGDGKGGGSGGEPGLVAPDSDSNQAQDGKRAGAGGGGGGVRRGGAGGSSDATGGAGGGGPGSSSIGTLLSPDVSSLRTFDGNGRVTIRWTNLMILTLRGAVPGGLPPMLTATMPALATGKVEFYESDGHLVGTAPLVEGTAFLLLRPGRLSPGVHHLYAAYDGNGQWPAGISNTVKFIESSGR